MIWHKPLVCIISLTDASIYDRTLKREYEHAQMYNGNEWVSDFYQGWIGIKLGYEYGGKGFKVYYKDYPNIPNITFIDMVTKHLLL
ncbi:MAG: hypothetical protein WCX31_22525 [Salinivirgaceae bacterium]